MKFAIYERATGRIIGHYTGSPKHLARNVPIGHGAVVGEYDSQSYRIDDETGIAIDWQPPQPDNDHEWSGSQRRWTKTPAAIERDSRRTAAMKRIESLERSQHRIIREAVIGKPGAIERAREIDAEIEALRVEITSADETQGV